MIPPAMRTMLSGIPKTRSIRAPKIKKKNISATAYRHRAASDASALVVVFASGRLKKHRQRLERIDDREGRVERSR